MIYYDDNYNNDDNNNRANIFYNFPILSRNGRLPDIKMTFIRGCGSIKSLVDVVTAEMSARDWGEQGVGTFYRVPEDCMPFPLPK